MRRILTALLALPMLASIAFAQTGTGRVADLDAPSSGRALESHYYAVGLGFPVNSYPDDTRRLIDELDAYDGVSRVPLQGSVAVYWPIADEHTMLGPAAEVTSDHLSRGDESISFNVVTIGVSARRYFTGVIGDGLFGRVDAGLASAGMRHELDGAASSASGNLGFGGQLGAGYAFAVSSGTSLEVSASGLLRVLPGHETGKPESRDDIFERGSYLSGTVGVAILW